MRIPFFSQLTRRIGIDLGTTYTRIWSDRDGVVINEPSCVAVDERTKKVVAVGREAQAMVGRVSDFIQVYYPIHDGQLYDFETGRAMLKVFLQRIFHSPYFLRPVIMVSLPAGSSEANRLSVSDLIYSLGAREVYTMTQPLAAAIGAGVPIADASGSFVMQLGSGCVEAAIISLGSVVAHQTDFQAGQAADIALKRSLRDSHGLVVSATMAERLKIAVGSVSTDQKKTLLVSGQDVVSISPKEIQITSAEIQPVFQVFAERYEQVLKKLLSRIPPELTVDIIDKGMLLSGSWAQLHGLDQYLVAQMGVPVSVVEDPGETVIKGIALALENLDLFKESLGYRS